MTDRLDPLEWSRQAAAASRNAAERLNAKGSRPMTDRAEPGVTPLTAEEDERVLRVEDMGPVERAYAEAMHEGCEDGPPHPLDAHSPWRGDEVGEPWGDFTAALARHGLSLALDAATPRPGLVEALAEWDAIEGSSLADQFRAFIAAGKMADAIRAALASGTGEPGLDDHAGEPHEFRTVCTRCQKPGFLHVALVTSDETFRIESANDKGADPTPEPK